jgi:hypothetical protein
LLVEPALDVVIPNVAHEDVQESFYSDEVVLSFEGSTSEKQALTWLTHWNKQNHIQLHLFETLANNLYLVEVRGEDTHIHQKTPCQVPIGT